MYVVSGLNESPDQIPSLLKKKYTGLIDRLAFYVAVRPGEDDARWKGLIAACH